MKVYAELDALLPHQLCVDVEEATRIPYGVREDLLVEVNDVPELHAEAEGRVRLPAVHCAQG